VLAVSEFTYNKKMETVPFVVGPMIMYAYAKKMKVPNGMVFSDTKVAGLYPYRGGGLNLSVILYKMERQNYDKDLLKIIESAATAVDFSTSLNVYVKVANIVLNGLERLFDLGGIQPIVGLRKELSDSGSLKPGYFALIDIPEQEFNSDELWVGDNKLLYGNSFGNAKAFRQSDFVLYSVGQTSERSDITTLPFYELWERIVEEATIPRQSSWENAKVNMVNLFQQLILSPDLTKSQAYELAKKFKSEMIVLHKDAVDHAELSPAEIKESELDLIRDESLKILRL